MDNNYNKDEVCSELADILNYCLLLADKLDVVPKEIVISKMKITEQKYPIDKSHGKSDSYLINTLKTYIRLFIYVFICYNIYNYLFLGGNLYG